MSLIKQFSFLLLLLLQIKIYAQKTSVLIDVEQEFKNGIELLDKQKYGAALNCFQNVIENSKNNRSIQKSDAEYYAAICALELFHKDGEWRLNKFIEENQGSNKLKSAFFHMGKSKYRKKKYQETIEWMEKVDSKELNKEDLAELYFKRGYSYLETGKTENAKLDLFEIKDVDNKYTHPANYYYSHIAYAEKNYQTALEGFNRLLNNETFGQIVPYYIAQIYFVQGKYEEVIKIGPGLLNDSNHVQKSGEINRIIGESYFFMKDYSNCVLYLAKQNPATRNGFYEMGFAFHKMGNYQSAIEKLELVLDAKDSMAQNAYYHLADCHLKLNDFSKARNSFQAAAQLNFSPEITEDALFNFANLCYETGFSPYNEAVISFQKYIELYPNSPRKDLAYSGLVNCLMTTKNYAQILKTIEQIENPDLTLKTIYQKLHYFIAVENYNNNNIDSAKKYFEKTIQLNTEAEYTALAKYWLGEIHYVKREYNLAVQTWKEYQLMSGALNQKEYTNSNYSIGYAYFQMKNYDDAGISFRKYLMAKNLSDAAKSADAHVRAADCLFMKKDYSGASEFYETAIALNKIDIDYSFFQKAMCNGLLKNYKEKINDLKSLEARFPKSGKISQSVYEIAESYKALKEDESAIEYYKKVIENHSNSIYVDRSIISIGMIYYNSNQDRKAFEYLDKIVQKNPKSEDSKSILPILKEIFKSENNPEEMENYFNSIGSSLSSGELEAEYYEKARKLYYDDKNCDASILEFKKYLSKFPDGKFLIEANFCLSECLYSINDFEGALPGYSVICDKPRSTFSEISSQKAAFIQFKKGNFEQALTFYKKYEEWSESPQNKLMSQIGGMRCAFKLNNYEFSIEYANKILNTDKITAQQTSEAKRVRAISMFETGRKDEAFDDFKYLSKNAKNETGAEAYFHIARIQLERKKYSEVEKTINSLFNYPYTTNDWNTKGMLIMGDAYFEKGDLQNAEATYQAIIENAEKQEYVDTAKNKLEQVKKNQSQRTAIENPESLRIDFQTPNKELFDSIPEIIDSTNVIQQPK